MHFRAIIMGHSGLNLSRDGHRHTCRPRRRTSVNVAKPQSASFEPSAISFHFGMTQAGIRLARVYTTPFSPIVDLSWHDVTAPACWMFWSKNGSCSGSMCSVNYVSSAVHKCSCGLLATYRRAGIKEMIIRDKLWIEQDADSSQPSFLQHGQNAMMCTCSRLTATRSPTQRPFHMAPWHCLTAGYEEVFWIPQHQGFEIHKSIKRIHGRFFSHRDVYTQGPVTLKYQNKGIFTDGRGFIHFCGFGHGFYTIVSNEGFLFKIALLRHAQPRKPKNEARHYLLLQMRKVRYSRWGMLLFDCN
jgi:hypothetical protein